MTPLEVTNQNLYQMWKVSVGSVLAPSKEVSGLMTKQSVDDIASRFERLAVVFPETRLEIKAFLKSLNSNGKDGESSVAKLEKGLLQAKAVLRRARSEFLEISNTNAELIERAEADYAEFRKSAREDLKQKIENLRVAYETSLEALGENEKNITEVEQTLKAALAQTPTPNKEQAAASGRFLALYERNNVRLQRAERAAYEKLRLAMADLRSGRSIDRATREEEAAFDAKRQRLIAEIDDARERMDDAEVAVDNAEIALEFKDYESASETDGDDALSGSARKSKDVYTYDYTIKDCWNAVVRTAL